MKNADFKKKLHEISSYLFQGIGVETNQNIDDFSSFVTTFQQQNNIITTFCQNPAAIKQCLQKEREKARSLSKMKKESLPIDNDLKLNKKRSTVQRFKQMDYSSLTTDNRKPESNLLI